MGAAADIERNAVDDSFCVLQIHAGRAAQRFELGDAHMQPITEYATNLGVLGLQKSNQSKAEFGAVSRARPLQLRRDLRKLKELYCLS